MATCGSGLNLKIAYNQVDADKNIEPDSDSAEISAVSVDTIKNDHEFLIDTVSQDLLRGSSRMSSDTISNFENKVDNILQSVMMPTTKSLSGIGSIFYFKNLIGKIAIAITFLVSLTLLFGLKLLKSFRINLYLAFSAVVCLIIFIIVSFISNVALLWGSWVLLSLLIVQLLLEYLNNTTKAYR